MSNNPVDKIVVIGIGNSALTDEGIGSRVVSQLQSKVPPGVELIDAGLPGPGLVDMLDGRDKAFIIDAIDAHAEPGKVFRFTPEEATVAQPHRRQSLHEGDMLQCIELARALKMAPDDIVIIGVQAQSLEPGDGLSPPVERAVPLAVEMILAEL